MQRDELELQKLQAEIAKLKAETETFRRSWAQRAGDSIKIIGAVLAALAAGYAAFETYRVTQVETRLANFEKEKAIRDKEIAEREQVEAAAKSGDAKRDLAELQAAVERAQVELSAARAEPATPELTKRLNDASANLRNVRVRGAAATRKIRIVIPDTELAQNLAKGVASALVERGYVGLSILIPAHYVQPLNTDIVFQRPDDRVAAEQLRAILKERDGSIHLRLSPFDSSDPGAIDVKVGARAR